MKLLGRYDRCAQALAYLLLPILLYGCDQQSAPPETPAVTKPRKVRNGEFREAAGEGRIDIVRKAIAEGIDVFDTDPAGNTALIYAAHNAHIDIVKLLLEQMLKRPELGIDQRDLMGLTALHHAATTPSADTVALLLDAGAGINAVDREEKYTPLMYAASLGHLEVVKLLLARGARADIRDADNDTALDFSVRNGHSEVAQLLMGK